MIDQTLHFFRANGFVLELFCCNLLFTFSQEKRSRYLLRILLATLALIASAVLLNLVVLETVYMNFFKYAVWFFITIIANMFLCTISFNVALFTGIGAFVCQHMAFKVGEIVQYFTPATMDAYTSSAIYLIVLVCMYAFAFLVFARRIKKMNVRDLANNQFVFLCIGVATYTTILQFLFVSYIDQIPTMLYLIYASFDLVCCIFAMSLQYGIFRTNTLEEENKLMEHVLHMQEEQYKATKENIEIINIKCHDLKKQLSSLQGLEENDLQMLYRTITVYDMSVKSGSEVLDILLAEKSLICEKQHIRLECMASGSSLNFMSSSDVYSLFGNAIDNAIESVVKVTDIEKRFINISIKQSLGLVVFHVENPYDESLQFEDGLPLTTKTDKDFHGFGLKSIQMIVKKYGGYLSIIAEDNLFSLNVVFTQNDSTVN